MMDYGGGDHQTADQGRVWMSGCKQKSVGAGLDCAAYVGCIRPLCLWHKKCRCGCCKRLVVLSVIPLPHAVTVLPSEVSHLDCVYFESWLSKP